MPNLPEYLPIDSGYLQLVADGMTKLTDGEAKHVAKEVLALRMEVKELRNAVQR